MSANSIAHRHTSAIEYSSCNKLTVLRYNYFRIPIRRRCNGSVDWNRLDMVWCCYNERTHAASIYNKIHTVQCIIQQSHPQLCVTDPCDKFTWLLIVVLVLVINYLHSSVWVSNARPLSSSSACSGCLIVGAVSIWKPWRTPDQLRLSRAWFDARDRLMLQSLTCGMDGWSGSYPQFSSHRLVFENPQTYELSSVKDCFNCILQWPAALISATPNYRIDSSILCIDGGDYCHRPVFVDLWVMHRWGYGCSRFNPCCLVVAKSLRWTWHRLRWRIVSKELLK